MVLLKNENSILPLQKRIAGKLYHNEEEKPTTLGITLEKPALIPEIAQNTKGLLDGFGVEDEIFLQILFREHNFNEKLPFEMPSSQEAGEKQLSDVPYYSENPLSPYGFGLSYLLK